MNDDSPLKGKFVRHIISDERHRIGQIREVLSDMVLVQFEADAAVPTLPMELVHFEDLCSTGDGHPEWDFFHTREERDAYIAWEGSSDEPKIVSLVPRKPQ